MKVGICGYGNLGRAVEINLLKEKKDELVAIFSRRINLKSDYETPIIDYKKAKNYKDDIDIMIMCGGSQEDLEWQSVEMLDNFNIIDTFDTHSRIQEHRFNLDAKAKANGKVAIYSCGWDPGLFSIMRTLVGNIFDYSPVTFWGKGVSQGHSEALRNIDGVEDAIQFTVPNEEVYQKVHDNPLLAIDENEKHERHCFVSLTGARKIEDVKKEICNVPDYFKGQKVYVTECSFDEIQEMKEKMYHQGIVFGGDERSRMDFSVKMDRNPNFTSQILLAYMNAIPKLKPGAYSVLDIPVSLIGDKNNERYM